MRKIWIVTLFPEFFEPLFKTGVVGSALRGERAQLPEIGFLNPSDYCDKGFKGVDDGPYGGGAGQVMRADVLEKTLLEGLKGVTGPESFKEHYKLIYLSPRGESWNQAISHDFAKELSEGQREWVFLCGRYEGVDERFLSTYCDSFISLGDFVVSGGELALIPILDSVFRLCRGVLGNTDSAVDESFEDGLLEYPQYTKPQEFRSQNVPDVLLSGHHGKISQWRKEQKKIMTKRYRPDLLKTAEETGKKGRS